MFEKIKEKILGNKEEINGTEMLESIDIMKALGGEENLIDIDSCTTRLRLKVKDNDLVNEDELAKLGVSGVIKPSDGIVQVVMGEKSESIANDIKKLINDKDLSETLLFIKAIGGGDNIIEIDSCTTRLRLKVKDSDKVDDSRLEELGALSIIKPSEGLVQIVMGDKSSKIAEEMKKILL